MIPTFREHLLAEGVDDPGILKAIFMAGGPGSGKSTVAQALFDLDAKIRASFSTYGLKVVNSDHAFETLLHQQGINPKELAAMHADPNQWAAVMQTRERAKRLTQMQHRGYERGRLGLIIDGTGDDAEKLRTKYRHAMAAGYDCYMVFVNTSLETALRRNAARPRSLPMEIVTSSWQDVQRNLGAFQRLFGAANFLIVDNEEAGAVYDVRAQVHQWMLRPVSNPIGRQWIAAAGGRHR